MLAAQVRLAFERAAALYGLPPIEWIMEQDTKPDIARKFDRSPSDYLLLRDVFTEGNRTVTFRPDSSCHLQIPRPSGKGYKSLLAYFEVDRSTEAHKQWQRKLRGITAFFREPEAWRRHWSDVRQPAVILFVVCPSKQRIDGISSVVRGTPVAKFFRFTTHPIDPKQLLTHPVWFDSEGQRYAIIKGQ